MQGAKRNVEDNLHSAIFYSSTLLLWFVIHAYTRLLDSQ